AVLAYHAPEIERVLERVGGTETGDNSRPECPYLLVVHSRIGRVDQKIHLIFLPVNMTQYLDQPGLHSTVFQFSEYMKNAHAIPACSWLIDSLPYTTKIGPVAWKLSGKSMRFPLPAGLGGDFLYKTEE